MANITAINSLIWKKIKNQTYYNAKKSYFRTGLIESIIPIQSMTVFDELLLSKDEKGMKL